MNQQLNHRSHLYPERQYIPEVKQLSDKIGERGRLYQRSNEMLQLSIDEMQIPQTYQLLATQLIPEFLQKELNQKLKQYRIKQQKQEEQSVSSQENGEELDEELSSSETIIDSDDQNSGQDGNDADDI